LHNHADDPLMTGAELVGDPIGVLPVLSTCSGGTT